MAKTSEFILTAILGPVPSLLPTVEDVRKVQLTFEDLERYYAQEPAYFNEFGMDSRAVRKSWMRRTSRIEAFRTNGVEAFVVEEGALQVSIQDIGGGYQYHRLYAGHTLFVPAYILRSIIPNSRSVLYRHAMLHQPQLESTDSVRDAATFMKLRREVQA